MPKNNSKIVSLLVLAFLIILLFIKRGENFLTGDFFYFIDQSRDMSLVSDIVWNRDIPLIGARSGIQGVFHGPLWLFYLVPFFIISSGDPFFTIVPALLIVEISTLISLVYIFGTLFKRQVGYVCGLFYTLGNDFTNAFNFGSNAQVSTLIFIWFLYFLVKLLRNEKMKSSFVAMSVLLALMFHFEYAFAPILISALLISLLAYFKKIGLIITITALFLVLVILSNFIVFNFRHDNLIYQSISTYLFDNKKTLAGYKEHSDLNYRLNDRIDMIIDIYTKPYLDPINMSLSPQQTGIKKIFATGIFFIAALYLLRHKREVLIISSMPLLYFTLTLIYPNPIWIHYYIPLYVCSYFLISYSTYRLICRKKNAMKIFIGLYSFFTSVILVLNYHPSSVMGGYQDHLNVVKEIFMKSKNDDIVRYFVYDTGKLTYGFDYMMNWYGKKTEKIIEKNKKGKYFVMSYPPPSWNKGEFEYWVRNVLRTDVGDRISQIKFGKILLGQYKTTPHEKEPIYSEVDFGNFYR